MDSREYGACTYQGGTWHITATPDVAVRLRQIFPRAAVAADGTLRLRHTPQIADELAWVMDRWPLSMTDPDMAMLTAAAQEQRRIEEGVGAILGGSSSLNHGTLLEPRLALRPYQAQARDLALETGALLLADDLGVGKTISGLSILGDPNLRPLLVVTPNGRLLRQWLRELAKVWPDLRGIILDTVRPYSLNDPILGDPDVIVTNYHPKLAGWASHLQGYVKSVVFDEVQELRHAGTAKYHAAQDVAAAATVRIGLSATPCYNYGGEIYNIMDVLNPGGLGTPAEFAREWCDSGQLTDKSRVTNPEALRAHLSRNGLYLRRTRSDVAIHLPPSQQLHHVVPYDADIIAGVMPGAQDMARRVLDAAATQEERWAAASSLDAMMRQATGLAKAPYVAAFARLVLETQQKCIIFGWHQDVYSVWEDLLAEYGVVRYTGTETDRQKNRAVDNFLRGPARVMLMSLRSGAGIDDIQKVCSTTIHGELDWSPGPHQQCDGRVDRPGQQHPVHAYYCIADGGSDPLVWEVQAQKREEQDRLLLTADEYAQRPHAGGMDTADHVAAMARQILGL